MVVSRLASLLPDYAAACDAHNADAVAKLFAPSATLDFVGGFGNLPPSIRSAAEISRTFAKRFQETAGITRKHYISNVRIRRNGPVRAQLSAYLLLVGSGPSGHVTVLTTGSYDAVARRALRGWLFESLTIDIDTPDPLAVAPPKRAPQDGSS